MKTLGAILSETKKLVDENPKLGFGDRYSSLYEEYMYLIRFMSNGYADEQRETLYMNMQKKASCLLSDLKSAIMFESIPYFQSLKREVSGMDSSSSALVELLKSSSVDEKNRGQKLSQVFNAVLLSPQWKEADSRLWISYLISDETDPFEACTMVSAIMLSAYTEFSLEKFKTLAFTYLTAVNQEVRQRALVGWTMCYDAGNELYEKEIGDIIAQLADDESVGQDVTAMLMQMYNCSHSEEATRKVESELMPKLAKGQSVKLTEMGLVDDDSSDAILDAGETEKAMEEMENSIKKMVDMQEKGVDLYFKGFSQMKRYPFFYKIANWFVPFSSHHPDVVDAYERIVSLKFAKRVFKSGPFCNSDKYSFVFALSHVFDSLPEKIRKMMEDGDMAPIGTVDGDDDRIVSAQYVRRMYLQDLYRFFRLFPQYHFEDIFVKKRLHAVLILSRLGRYDDSINTLTYASFLLRHGALSEFDKLVPTLPADSRDAMLLMAMYWQKRGAEKLAYERYGKLLKDSPSDVAVLSGFAKTSYTMGFYKEAAAAYDRLRTLKSDNLSYQINYVMAEVGSGRAEEMVNEAYRLDYENAGNVKVKRMLAWTLLSAKRLSQADKTFSEILSGNWELHSSDYLNASYAKWFMGDINATVTLLHKYLSVLGVKKNGEKEEEGRFGVLLDAIGNDMEMLRLYGKDAVDVMLIVDAVREK